MLNKNFNTLLANSFNNNAQGSNYHATNNRTDAQLYLSSLTNLCPSTSIADMVNRDADETGLFLFTSTFEDSVETYILTEGAEFAVYTLSSFTKTDKNQHDLGVAYTRVIVPKVNVEIKAICLAGYHNYGAILFAFENLAEPVQLTAGEPHTFTFTIKV